MAKKQKKPVFWQAPISLAYDAEMLQYSKNPDVMGVYHMLGALAKEAENGGWVEKKISLLAWSWHYDETEFRACLANLEKIDRIRIENDKIFICSYAEDQSLTKSDREISFENKRNYIYQKRGSKDETAKDKVSMKNFSNVYPVLVQMGLLSNDGISTIIETSNGFRSDQIREVLDKLYQEKYGYQFLRAVYVEADSDLRGENDPVWDEILQVLESGVIPEVENHEENPSKTEKAVESKKEETSDHTADLEGEESENGLEIEEKYKRILESDFLVFYEAIKSLGFLNPDGIRLLFNPREEKIKVFLSYFEKLENGEFGSSTPKTVRDGLSYPENDMVKNPETINRIYEKILKISKTFDPPLTAETSDHTADLEGEEEEIDPEIKEKIMELLESHVVIDVWDAYTDCLIDENENFEWGAVERAKNKNENYLSLLDFLNKYNWKIIFNEDLLSFLEVLPHNPQEDDSFDSPPTVESSDDPVSEREEDVLEKFKDLDRSSVCGFLVRDESSKGLINIFCNVDPTEFLKENVRLQELGISTDMNRFLGGFPNGKLYKSEDALDAMRIIIESVEESEKEKPEVIEDADDLPF